MERRSVGDAGGGDQLGGGDAVIKGVVRLLQLEASRARILKVQEGQ